MYCTQSGRVALVYIKKKGVSKAITSSQGGKTKRAVRMNERVHARL